MSGDSDHFQNRPLNHILDVHEGFDQLKVSNTRNCLLSESRVLNIGTENVTGPSHTLDSLKSSEQTELQKLSLTLGKNTVSRHQIEGAPNWLLDEAVKKEIDETWNGAFEEVNDDAVGPNENVISSHMIYNIKQGEGGKFKLKARLCPHGNRDHEKGMIRSDSSNVQFEDIRLLLSIATFLEFRLGCIDVTAAYL